MFAWPRSLSKKRMVGYALGAALAGAGAMACGSGSPSGPSASCRTVASATHSVQTFENGQVVTVDSTCTFNSATNEVTCPNTFTDSTLGAGTGTQTSRFASRGDIVDEGAANPPLTRSLGTTTVMSIPGLTLTATSTNTYDSQKRLTSITVVSDFVGTLTTTYTAWDSAGRPTAGASGSFPSTMSYDDANHTATRNNGQDICTVTYDQNGIMIKEVCTGVTASTTNITIQSTQSICR